MAGYNIDRYKVLVSLQARGGNGGNVITDNPHGPGGGGGGGAIYLNTVADTNVAGGSAGFFSGGGNHGAEDGGVGETGTGADVERDDIFSF